jgi:endoglucanase
MMYERVGNAILGVDPTKLIIAEGPQNYTQQVPWGDLSHAGDAPVNLNIPNHVVYSIHDYPQEIAAYQPDNGPDKITQMNHAWGYLVIENLAPVWIGELGSSMQAASDGAWAQTVIDYTNGHAAGGPTFAPGQLGIGTDWWAWGALDNQLPDGTQNDDGSLRQDQYSVYSQLR